MILLRIVCCIGMLVASILLPWFIVLPLAVVYVLWSRAYELVVLAAFIDAYFGSAVLIPYYTLTAAALFLVAEWVKPSLSFYTRNT
ncbi:MAG: hypothetical protein WDZ93_00945 [Candidatus Paceibacterota bacterium]